MEWSEQILLVLLVQMIIHLTGAIHFHNPPGSANRNRELSFSRVNAARLFDSQVSSTAGYPWRGDTTLAEGDLIYFKGSVLQLEWTLTMPAETSNADIIVQAACDEHMPGLRAGYPLGSVVEIDGGNPGYQQR